MLIWILAGVALGLIPLIVLAIASDRKYRRLFRDAHLVELAALLMSLRGEADAADAERSGLTSADLAVTWRSRGPEILVSYGHGKLARAAASFLLCWIEAYLGLPEGTRARYIAAASGRYLLRIEALPEGVTPALEPPDEARLAALRAAAADRMRALSFAPA